MMEEIIRLQGRTFLFKQRKLVWRAMYCNTKEIDVDVERREAYEKGYRYDGRPLWSTKVGYYSILGDIMTWYPGKKKYSRGAYRILLGALSANIQCLIKE